MAEATVIGKFRSLPSPRDYYKGRGDSSFSLPLNILFFYRDRFDDTTLGLNTNFHYRHVLILNCGDAIRVMVDGSPLSLKTGCFLLLLPYQYHRFISDGQEGLSMLFITFEMEENLALISLRNLPHRFEPSVLEILNTAADLYHEQKSGELPFWVAALLARLLASAESVEGLQKPAGRETAGLVSELCRRIYRNRKLTIGDLSRETGYSEGYLRSTFRRTMNVSLGRYMLESRLTEAMKYLSTTDRSVSEIAELAGYDSIYSLSRSFRNHVGMTPTQYRKERNRKCSESCCF